MHLPACIAERRYLAATWYNLLKLHPDIKLQRNILLTASSRNTERIILADSKLFITVEETKNRHIWKRARTNNTKIQTHDMEDSCGKQN